KRNIVTAQPMAQAATAITAIPTGPSFSSQLRLRDSAEASPWSGFSSCCGCAAAGACGAPLPRTVFRLGRATCPCGLGVGADGAAARAGASGAVRGDSAKAGALLGAGPASRAG